MDKKLFSFLFSTRLMAVLFLVFAAAMAAGTFIENDYNTTTARILIYNSWWFEAIMVLFFINFAGNIGRYQLWKREKWPTLIIHLSFVFIILGAFITRYISFEGMMPIREGATSSQIYSEKTFLTTFVDGDYQGEIRRLTFEKNLLMSQVTSNDFSMKKEFNNIPFQVEYVDFVMNAVEKVVPSETGVFYLKLVESSDGERHEHYLKEGEVQNIHNVLYAFNKDTDGAINIFKNGDDYTIKSPFAGDFMRMADQFKDVVAENQVQKLNFRSLYNLQGVQFVLPELPQRGAIAYVSNNDYKDELTDDALTVKVTSQGKEEIITLLGDKGKVGEPKSFKIGKLEFTLMFGSKIYTTPFEVTLNKFIADKYPGTEKSYSGFESQVTVVDKEENKKFDARIFMNNILDYRGYRLFQASFDPDEKGTRLSVNHDYWGTTITYIGYTLLYISMMLILFLKGSRFVDLQSKLKKLKDKKEALAAETADKNTSKSFLKKGKLPLIIAFFFSMGMFAQAPAAKTPMPQTQEQKAHDHSAHDGHDHSAHDGHDHSAHAQEAAQPVQAPQLPNQAVIDSLIQRYKVSEAHSDKFGRLIIQDAGGRMKPLHTFSSELLRKVSQSDTFNGMNSDQVFISMTQFPQLWYNISMIKLPKHNDSLYHILGVAKDQKLASLMDFFDPRGNYKLTGQLEDAFKAAVPNQFQKDFIEIDKRVNLLHAALSGQILKVFPIPYDKNNKWVSYLELNEAGLTGIDSLFTKNVLPMYLDALDKTVDSKDYDAADTFLDGLIKFQKKYGNKVYPTEEKIDAEIMYNKYDVFKKLYSYYLLAGLLMFVFVIVRIFKDSKVMRFLTNASHVVIVLLFAMHTLGLMARWYISGHAPWSDAYESMIYVGWATMLFGILFGKKSQLTVASTTFVVSMILWVAHLSWMDPAIANLQPVLNSYWLMIHVAVIVGSYGPFALGMILGIVALILMIFTTDKNKQKMTLNIAEITYINEMALTIGLVMLTIGNFLGGQWANESWGRYWGWDPKETWALISIMIYSFVIHARFVPALRSKFIYNVMSIFAFYSVLMTYFGVNFYLSGLHSYAKGDKVVTPSFVYYSVATLVVFCVIAYFRYKKHYKK